MNLFKKTIVFISLFFFGAVPALACTVSSSPSTITTGADTPVTFTVSSFSNSPTVSGNYFSWDISSGNSTYTSVTTESYNSNTLNSSSNNYLYQINAVQASYDQHAVLHGGTVGSFTLVFDYFPPGSAFDENCTTNITVSSGGGGGGSGQISLDPTVGANLNAGLGSVGTTIVGEASNLLPIVLLVTGGLFVITFGVSFLFKHARNRGM